IPSVPMVGVSIRGSVSTAGPASNTIMLIPTAGLSETARGAGNDAVSLNTFLDVNASPNIPQRKAGVQRPGSNPYAVGDRNPPSADGDAGAEGLLSETDAEQLEAPSSEEQGPEALPPSGQADEVCSPVPVGSRAESADGRALGNERVETQDGGGWTNLMTILLVVSIPVIWTCVARHRRW